MKTAKYRRPDGAEWLTRARSALLAAALGVALLVPEARGQLVQTVTGGPNQTNSSPNGYADGSTFAIAQFNFPAGVALDTSGRLLYVADRNNNAVRIVDLTGGLTYTLTTNGLNNPVGVVLDTVGDTFVVNETGGTITKYDPFTNLVATWTGLTSPTAIALDSTNNLYVIQLNGLLRRITNALTATGATPVAGSSVTITPAGTFTTPRGVVIREDGKIAVSDTGINAIRLVDPATLVVTFLTLPNGAGFADGPPALAMMNAPHNIARAGGNTLVVADRLNSRVRIVASDGTVKNLYGVSPSTWQGLDGANFLGWFDGTAQFAEAREPYGVVVDGGGNVFASEVFYHILRRATSTGLTGPAGVGAAPAPIGGGTTNVPPPSLSISPDSGYYPMGRNIVVTSSSASVFYTTDGTDPTTSSSAVVMNGSTGLISWRNATNDLTALRVKAFASSTSFTNVSGVASSVNDIGVPPTLNTNILAGSGATVMMPVVVNLRTNQSLRSVIFRVEVTPVGAAPNLTGQFRTIAITTNDFISVVTSDTAGVANFSSFTYSITNGATVTSGLAISFVGQAANFSVSRFSVVAMLAVPVPGTATPGQTYSITVINPSGTSDASETPVTISGSASRTILVSNIPYVVGDTAPRGWYNAGDFGNGNLSAIDVNNAFSASLGIKIPYPFTDAFDAMDAFPDDTTGVVGGDGQIRFLDWQTILFRSLRLNQNNFVRAWGAGGFRVNATTNLNSAALVPAPSLSVAPGAVWNRQAMLSASAVENAGPGSLVSVPVYVKVAAGASLSGMQFRAEVVGEGGAPALGSSPTFLSFVAAPNSFATGLPGNQFGLAWNIGALSLPGGASHLLGYIQFVVPAQAQTGQYYTIRFLNADGSPNLNTQYDLETRSASVWVRTAATQAASLISDEWKQRFFPNDAAGSDPNADPDGDGVPNWMEFLAGTDPTDANSRLRLGSTEVRQTGGQREIVFQLLTAPGKTYVLESTTNVVTGPWTGVSTNVGDGNFTSFFETTSTDAGKFYRVRLLP